MGSQLHADLLYHRVVFATLGTATLSDALLVAAITVVMFVIPLIINHFKKDSWGIEVEKSLEEK